MRRAPWTSRIGSRPVWKQPGRSKTAKPRCSSDRKSVLARTRPGLSQNHGFVDGNKRAAFLPGVVFLAENGYDVVAEQAEVIAAMLDLADHQLDENGLCAVA